MEELADLGVQALQEGIDIERKFITKEHELETKLWAIDSVFGYLDQLLPHKLEHLHELNHIIYENILDIREYLESNELTDIQFIKEEKSFLEKLNKEIKHKEWQLAIQNSNTEKKEKKKFIRSKHKHLKELHQRFKQFKQHMESHQLLKALEKDMIKKQDKSKYINIEEHYFLEIYHFIKNYEHILDHLLHKEEYLLKKIK